MSYARLCPARRSEFILEAGGADSPRAALPSRRQAGRERQMPRFDNALVVVF